MAMIRVEPVGIRVRAGWLDGRPRQVVWRDERLPVTRLAAIRREESAYPAHVGPRTLFEVETPRALLALSFQHHSRRWTLEGVDEEVRQA